MGGGGGWVGGILVVTATESNDRLPGHRTACFWATLGTLVGKGIRPTSPIHYIPPSMLGPADYLDACSSSPTSGSSI